MGIFEKFGRQVEQFKQTAKETAEENANYQCRACDARFNTHEGQCPECGATKITAAETEE
jgi:rubrerythrin